MERYIINLYTKFLEKAYAKKFIDSPEYESIEELYTLSIFGSYGSGHNLVRGLEKDIDKYSKCIQVTETKLNIDNSWKNNNIIVLRPYNGEKILVVGCGNLYHYKEDENDEDHWKNFAKKHKHRNEYTINPDIEMNPSVCTEFGKTKLECIPDNVFNKVIFEGFCYDSYTDDLEQYFISEIIRVLKDNGYLCTNHGRRLKKVFVKQDNKLKHLTKDIILEKGVDAKLFLDRRNQK